MKKNGFSLMEISVVLVIIGLLIAGLVVGNSLIRSAGINTVITQVNKYDIAVKNFKDKYRALPGDSTAHGGDGDRMIERYPDEDNHLEHPQGEIAHFWPNLYPDRYTLLEMAIPEPEINAPGVKVARKGSVILAQAIGNGDNTANTTNKANYYAILSIYNFDSADDASLKRGGTGFEAMKPANLLALDKKIDDSGANSGIVIAGSIGAGNGGVAGIDDAALAGCSSGAAYEADNDTFECTPLIRIGGTQNELY